jgi:hypothetical protein
MVPAEVTTASAETYQVNFRRAGTVAAQQYEVAPDGQLRRLSGPTWMQPYALSIEPPG